LFCDGRWLSSRCCLCALQCEQSGLLLLILCHITCECSRHVLHNVLVYRFDIHKITHRGLCDDSIFVGKTIRMRREEDWRLMPWINKII
jgi:hypothetical protein